MFDDKHTEYESINPTISSKSRPYLDDVTDKFKKQGEWKFLLIMNVNFISPKDNNEKQLICSSDNRNQIIELV